MKLLVMTRWRGSPPWPFYVAVGGGPVPISRSVTVAFNGGIVYWRHEVTQALGLDLALPTLG